MRRTLCLLLAAALAGCAAPRGRALDHVHLGPTMEIVGPLYGTVTVAPPRDK